MSPVTLLKVTHPGWERASYGTNFKECITKKCNTAPQSGIVVTFTMFSFQISTLSSLRGTLVLVQESAPPEYGFAILKRTPNISLSAIPRHVKCQTVQSHATTKPTRWCPGKVHSWSLALFCGTIYGDALFLMAAAEGGNPVEIRGP